MSEQPKALRLADGLEDAYPNVYTGLAQSSAAELRRLHALCEEMGVALEGLDNKVRRVFRDNRWFWEDYPEIIKAAEVRAKWKETE